MCLGRADGRPLKRLIERKDLDSPTDLAHPREMKYVSLKSARARVTFISLLLVLGILSPAQARAGVFGDFVAAIMGKPEKQINASTGAQDVG